MLAFSHRLGLREPSLSAIPSDAVPLFQASSLAAFLLQALDTLRLMLLDSMVHRNPLVRTHR